MSFLVPVIVIPVLFYGYRAILKVKSCLPIDITIFFVASFASSAAFVGLMDLAPMGESGQIVSIIISVIVLAMYLSLTRFPMHNFLFRDPITGRYGYDGHNVRKRKNATARKR